ncbi:MAG: hypothetical protein Hyperionvirus4_75 [Hyperionvirus sp.]|uniref:Uncharacterized protein n=1 Tax=Hyperionvirus sp. TaxID=2487770 RepID=A0A3G5A772_9VIRU|nr:MAG: hypothetical protein Hyperionvirus4_75 [Hyperionvirus sp.]
MVKTDASRFDIRFRLFSRSIIITDKHIQIKKDLYKNHLKEIFRKLNLNDIKFLDRTEPAISTLDENKQLRLVVAEYLQPHMFNKYNMILRNYGKDSFDIDELKYISNQIRHHLEKYLGYGIQTSLICEIYGFDD